MGWKIVEGNFIQILHKNTAIVHLGDGEMNIKYVEVFIEFWVTI